MSLKSHQILNNNLGGRTLFDVVSLTPPFLLKRKITLQGTNISHQWKRKLIFPTTLGMGYVSFRVIAQLPASTQRNLPGNRKLILPTGGTASMCGGSPGFLPHLLDPVSWGQQNKIRNKNSWDILTTRKTLTFFPD